MADVTPPAGYSLVSSPAITPPPGYTLMGQTPAPSGVVGSVINGMAGLAGAVRHPIDTITHAAQPGDDSALGTAVKDVAGYGKSVADMVTNVSMARHGNVQPMIDTFTNQLSGLAHTITNLPHDLKTDIAQGKYGKLGVRALEFLLPVVGSDSGLASISAAADATAPARAAISAGVKAAAPDVAMGAGKAATGYALSEMLPGSGAKYLVGAQPVYSGVKQIGRGLKAGMDAGKAALTQRVQAAVDAVTAPEAEAAVVPPAEPAAQASPAQAAPAAPSSTISAAEVARMNPADFAKLPAKQQRAAQATADALNSMVQSGMEAPEPAPLPAEDSAPQVPPQAGFAPSRQPEMAAPANGVPSVAAEAAPQAGEPTIPKTNPLQAALKRKQAAAASNKAKLIRAPRSAAAPVEMPSVATEAPATVAGPTVPNTNGSTKLSPQQIAQQLRDEMASSGTLTEAPSEPVNPFETSARTVKAKQLADFLHQGGISVEDAKSMDASHWKLVSDGLGMKSPSEATISEAVNQLEGMQKASSVGTGQPPVSTAAPAAIEPAPQASGPLARPAQPVAPQPGTPASAVAQQFPARTAGAPVQMPSVASDAPSPQAASPVRTAKSTSAPPEPPSWYEQQKLKLGKMKGLTAEDIEYYQKELDQYQQYEQNSQYPLDIRPDAERWMAKAAKRAREAQQAARDEAYFQSLQDKHLVQTRYAKGEYVTPTPYTEAEKQSIVKKYRKLDAKYNAFLKTRGGE